MEQKMFCFQCQETAGGKGCTMSGVCGKKPDVAMKHRSFSEPIRRVIFEISMHYSENLSLSYLSSTSVTVLQPVL